MITIANLRTGRPAKDTDVRVDRSSPLGNPFHMRTEADRMKVCEQYAQWLQAQIPSNRIVCEELNRLIRIYRTHGTLTLWCWCAPKQCHAETIKALLVKKLMEYGIKV